MSGAANESSDGDGDVADVVVVGTGPVGQSVADQVRSFGLGVAVVEREPVGGHGRLDGPRRVVVETLDGGRVLLTARHAVVVCTGSGAALPDLPGSAEAGPWTNREATAAASRGGPR